MGPLRRGLILAAAPTPALAEVCDKLRPDWDGQTVTALSEALSLTASLPSLILLAGTVAALRFRNQTLALVVVVLWTILVSILGLRAPGGVQAQAIIEGCVGTPALFIAAVVAICVGTIIYTGPFRRRADEGS